MCYRLGPKNAFSYLFSVCLVLHQSHLSVAPFAHGLDESVIIHHSSTCFTARH